MSIDPSPMYGKSEPIVSYRPPDSLVNCSLDVHAITTMAVIWRSWSKVIKGNPSFRKKTGGSGVDHDGKWTFKGSWGN